MWQVSQGSFTIACNLMLYGITRYVARVGGIAPWRVISLFLGELTLLGSLFSWYILGAPTKVRWLNEEEKKMA
jgi:MFS transporter, ACS family, allantoate permease